MNPGALLFPTAIGTCGVAWTGTGIRAVQLPGPSERQVLRCLQQSCPDASRLADEPPAPIRRAVRRLQAHLAGSVDRRGLRDLLLDLGHLSPFTRAVYRAAQQVDPGQTTTYAELARRCGSPGAARAVGQAMARNPVPLLVPCHRVLAADGGLGGFSAHGGPCTKLRLLTLEGADLRALARAGTRRLRREDARLAPLIRRVGPFPLLERPRTAPLTALVESIIHQQVSMKAGAAIYRRLVQLLGGGPTAAGLAGQSAARLRDAGVSAQKARYLQDLSRKVLDGTLQLSRLRRMDDEAVIEQLTRVKGIGRWSAEMYLMFHLGRLDVLPVDDWGLRRGAQRVYGLRAPPEPGRLRRMGRGWRPFRSIASWYLWRAQEGGGLS